ncbi:MAG TPA: hypothetical protein PKH10_04775 [bacterium]|nr:hypothetical protein [bacterium]
MLSLPADIFVEMPGQLAPFETPFDAPGLPAARCRFIFLGNRTKGRYSSLLPFDYDFAALGWGLADYFPMGYANLYHIEKIRAFHPDPAQAPQARTDNRREPPLYRPKGLGSRPEEGALYYVFRAPIVTEWGRDIIGLSFSEKRAMAMAERYVETYGRVALVGLLLVKVTWH